MKKNEVSPDTVLVFAFSEDLNEVVLIEKKRPKWQRGRLNGVGGKLNDGEKPRDAALREFEEETGIKLKEEDLVLNGFVVLRCDKPGISPVISVYSARTDEVKFARSTTDEKVKIMPANTLYEESCINNVQALVNLCKLRYNSRPQEKFSHFNISYNG